MEFVTLFWPIPYIHPVRTYIVNTSACFQVFPETESAYRSGGGPISYGYASDLLKKL